MNKLKRLLCVTCVLSTTPFIQAMNYYGSDLLLVFRQDNFNDVEFDLGPISQFVGLTNGTTKAVPYSVDLVKSNFNGTLSGAKFLLSAATALNATQPRVWISAGTSAPIPNDVSYSKFSQIRSKVSAVGQNATVLTLSNAAPAVVAPTQPGSFTFIASDGNLTPAGSLGGLTEAPMEAVVVGTTPTTLNFYEVQASTAYPRPAASQLGSFTLDANGGLTFTAGSGQVLSQPTLAIAHSSGKTTISFNSVQGLKYQLHAAAAVTGSFSPVGDVVTGTGGQLSLTDTSSDPARFYRVQVTN